MVNGRIPKYRRRITKEESSLLPSAEAWDDAINCNAQDWEMNISVGNKSALVSVRVGIDWSAVTTSLQTPINGKCCW
jgi:hypothetical protein